ncbi:hypothetical protein IV203_019203 [Nitzschia inconspicua]|uniref:Uncharacterized protein n=1 Tax=Nitzschia inconspicua TaxID=303405 RepID=A0A9K3Q4A2_9STRA|nr:hypothetical protein IV203_019203 [Nitzschia inconspicua]
MSTVVLASGRDRSHQTPPTKRFLNYIPEVPIRQHFLGCGDLFELERGYSTEPRGKKKSHQGRSANEDNDVQPKFKHGVILSKCCNGMDTAPCEFSKVHDEENEILLSTYNNGRNIN